MNPTEMKKQLSLLCIAAVLLALMACGKRQPVGVLVTNNDKTQYYGELSNGKPCGYGVLTIGDSVVYSGQWKDGKRNGCGTASDSLGRKITGTWRADTLISGTRTDTLGIYTGEMNAQLQPHGHGVYRGADGSWYDGAWQNGVRSGFGCAVTADGKVRVGEWKAGRYRGERMTYTAERIYGIDISRYQHGKGRKKYKIDWAKVRITGLGKISQKKVSGSVSYPVSFVYIKSTEGTTVRNPFFLSDYRQARKHGIRCGAYHFFSPTSKPSKQAYYFLKHTKYQKGDFPPVLDVEPSHAQVRAMGGTEAMLSRVRTWLNIVHKHTGVRPILYVSQSFVNRYLPSAPDIIRDYRVWIARYGEYRPDVRLVFWQLCPDGRVQGIRGDVDINVFNGYRDQYEKFVSAATLQ